MTQKTKESVNGIVTARRASNSCDENGIVLAESQWFGVATLSQLCGKLAVLGLLASPDNSDMPACGECGEQERRRACFFCSNSYR